MLRATELYETPPGYLWLTLLFLESFFHTDMKVLEEVRVREMHAIVLMQI